MKKFTSILIILSFLASTAGFSMDIHHCGGKVSYDIFGLSLKKHCGCNHKKEAHPTKCCHDKKVEIKAEKKDKISAKTIAAKCSIKEVLFFNKPLTTIAKAVFVFRHQSPLKAEHPPGYSPPVYLRGGAFLI